MLAAIAAGVVVAQVARQRRIQLGFPAIETERVVADRACIRGHGRRPADQLHRQVRGRVVAVLDRRLAQLRHRHPGVDMPARHGRGVDEIGLRIRHALLQQTGMLDAPREHRRAEHRLERTAERKALVSAMLRAPAARGIDRAYAEAAARRPLERGERRGGRDVGCGGRRRRARADGHDERRRCRGQQQGSTLR
jgi:hypothetical protein